VSQLGRILVVEDDEAIRTGLVDRLGTEGYEVEAAHDGSAGLTAAQNSEFDCIVLDLMLPITDGYTVCRKLREEGNTTPILILSARDTETDRILGLDLGADDYVTKPFGVAEILARIRALLRRTRMSEDPLQSVTIGNTVIDFEAYEARSENEKFPLSQIEAKMLALLVCNSGKVVSRNEFLSKVWGYESFPTTRTVDFHILKLRQKIEPDSDKPVHILTVHGVGYKLVL